MRNVSRPEEKEPPATLPPILGQNSSEPEMPPCLAALRRQGIPEGKRNEALFNFFVFLRKTHPDDWEMLAPELNEEICKPPLPQGEVYSIIQSVRQTRYHYKCSQEPILSLCRRGHCETLEFGVNNMPWQGKGLLDEFTIRRLQKVKTDPPLYIAEVNGQDITLSNEELYDFEKFRRRVEDLLDLVIDTIKPAEWRKKRYELNSKLEIIEAPEDASANGSIINSVMDFLTQYKNSTAAEDILKGVPLELEGRIGFRSQDLVRFLTLHRRHYIHKEQLFVLLHPLGVRFASTEIKGRKVEIWLFPKEKLNIQTEDFTPVEFPNTADEI